jgi:hypothetical protein
LYRLFLAYVSGFGKDLMPVVIKSQRKSIALHELLGQFKIALTILLLTKEGGEHLTCSIIDSCHQAQTRPSLLQPGMRTAINLY